MSLTVNSRGITGSMFTGEFAKNDTWTKTTSTADISVSMQIADGLTSSIKPGYGRFTLV
jgi:hypothetical protein